MDRIVSSLACLGLLAPALTATSINFVGVEAAGAVENWSKTSVAKNHDINGDNRFGGAGYYQIMPAPLNVVFGSSWSVNLDDPNDLGILLPQVPPVGVSNTVHSKPVFLTANPAGGGGSCFIFETNPVFSNPSGSGFLRQGSLAVSITNYEAIAPGDAPASSAKAFSFTLSQAADFRLGVAVGNLSGSNSAVYAPDYVSVSNVNTGEFFSTQLTRDAIADMVFFDIHGGVGNEFVVNLWQTNSLIGVDGPIAFALVTFDKAPTPTLTCTHDGGNITLAWEAWIRGWILESSTDLGVGDDWESVLGVNYETNSVTFRGITKSKNFFRLKKNP